MNDTLIRPYESSDKEFIYASWLDNYKHSSPITKRIKNQIFYGGEHQVIDDIMSRPTTTTTIACLPEMPDAILGYLVSEMYKDTCQTLHFCLVKKEWREQGIAKLLVTFTGYDLTKDVYFTHWTNPMESLVNRKDIRLTYDPYKI